MKSDKLLHRGKGIEEKVVTPIKISYHTCKKFVIKVHIDIEHIFNNLVNLEVSFKHAISFEQMLHKFW